MNQKLKEWRNETDKLSVEMDEWIKNYKCKKCSEYYCSHMIKASAKKFKKKCDEEMSKLLIAVWKR